MSIGIYDHGDELNPASEPPCDEKVVAITICVIFILPIIGHLIGIWWKLK